MSKSSVRRLLSDGVRQQFEVALRAAKYSQAGAPPAMSDRDFLEAVLYLVR